MAEVASAGRHARNLPQPPDPLLADWSMRTFRPAVGDQRAAPGDVKLIIAATVDATTNGQAIRFRVDVTHFIPGEAPNDATIAYDWPVPDDWTANDPREVAIDNGNGVTFDADHFEAGDHLGLFIRRMGAATEDRFDKDLLICDAMAFE